MFHPHMRGKKKLLLIFLTYYLLITVMPRNFWVWKKQKTGVAVVLCAIQDSVVL